MVLIGDYFALVLLSIVCLLYFEGNGSMTTAGKFFTYSLILSGATALLDIAATLLLESAAIPIPVNIAVNTLYFIVNILSTSAMAMLLFLKILEHVHDDHCIKKAKLGLSVILSVYMIFVIVNIPTGILFSISADGVYARGPLNMIGYVAVMAQMALVVICYIRNRKSVTKIMQRVLIQTFPIAIFSIFIQLSFPDVLLNGLIMALVNLILFLNFQNQRPGTHNLTKLNDRHRLFKHIEDGIKNQKPFRIYVIGIRNYETINQKYGHKIGDEVLYLFAFSLEKLIGKAIAFHMDSVKFALTIPVGEGDPQKNLEKIYDFINNGVVFGKERIQLDCNVMEHALDPTHTDASDFYEELEYGVDLAKLEGVKYLKYSEDLTKAMLRRRYLIERIEKVDKQHGFEVWFQPIRCTRNEKFCSMEALIRLKEPDDTMISPLEFIPIAEQAAMISPMTHFVLEETCRTLSTHEQLSNVSVSINLTMAQLLDPDFEEQLNSVTDKYGIAHRRICLEITERFMLNDFERTKEVMQKLSKNGYRFFLDDFGTGLSNFNCILELPFESIKLDMSLTSTVTGEKKSAGLVKTLTGLFHNMELEVIAEGVETSEQVDVLRSFGIDKIQGYYYSRPMNVSSLINFYESLDEKNK